MRDHMMGWIGAVEQVNLWHPETRKSQRTPVRTRMSKDEEENRKVLDNEKLSASYRKAFSNLAEKPTKESTSEEWWKSLEPGDEVIPLYNCARNVRGFVTRVVISPKQIFFKFEGEEEEVFDYPSSLAPGRKKAEISPGQSETPLTLIVGKVYKVASPLGIRYSKYLEEGQWSAMSKTALRAASVNIETLYSLSQIKPIRLADPVC